MIEVLVAGARIDTVEEFGVVRPKVTVTYRFSQPDQPMPLVLPQMYTTGQVIRVPTDPQTVGDHIRARRIALKLMQKEAARQIGTDVASVRNWEANRSQPEIRFMPAVIRFLGFNPLPPATTFSERLVRHRTGLGIPQKVAARQIGVDPGTLARWERGQRAPTGALLKAATAFLAASTEALANRRVG